MQLEGIAVCQHVLQKFNMVLCFNLKSEKIFVGGCTGVFDSCNNTFSKKEVPPIIEARYGNKILKLLRKLENSDFKLRKVKLDINFLCKYENDNKIPNFLFSNS